MARSYQSELSREDLAVTINYFRLLVLAGSAMTLTSCIHYVPASPDYKPYYPTLPTPSHTSSLAPAASPVPLAAEANRADARG